MRCPPTIAGRSTRALVASVGLGLVACTGVAAPTSTTPTVATPTVTTAATPPSCENSVPWPTWAIEYTWFWDDFVRDTGLWAVLDDSTLVVRGVLAGREDLEFRGSLYEAWQVQVERPILPSSAGPNSVTIMRLVCSADSGPDPVYREWEEGSEAIFFLAPWLIARGAGSADVYQVSLGIGVVWEDLDRWEEVIPMGGHLLGTDNLLAVSLEARLATAEMAVVGVVTGEAGTVSTVAGDFAVLEVGPSQRLWPPGDHLDAGSLSTLAVWVPVDSESLYLGDAPRVFLLARTYDQCCFALVGGANGVLPVGEAESVKAGIAAANGLGGRQANANAVTSRGLEAIRLAGEFGRIPTDYAGDGMWSAPEIDRSAILSELIRQPLEVVVGELRVVFDQWFFSTFDLAARVMVVDADERVLADGLVAGPDAILVQEEGFGWVIVGSDGGEVVRFTHAQLHEAADAAARAAGVID
jgi:hypothetical protein